MDLPIVAIEICEPPPTLSKSPPVRLLKRSNPYFRADEFRKVGSAAGGRQEWFCEQLSLISKALASRHIPFAFIDKAGKRYVLDRGAVKFAANVGFICALEENSLGVVREVVLVSDLL